MIRLPPQFFSRRDVLRRAAGGFGGIALAGMLADQARAAAAADPLAPKLAHFPAKAKSVIFIFATGGASHVDTFDHKPKLYADHGQTLTTDDPYGQKGIVKTYLKRPGWDFKRYGQSGTLVSDLFPHLGQCADDFCVIRSMYGDSPGHGVHVHDLHATLLHLLGLDHEKLTYRFSGRDYRLTDVAGRVVKQILS